MLLPVRWGITLNPLAARSPSLPNPKYKVLAIPDLHIPFQHRDALEFIAAVHKREHPDITVNLGDEGDYHGLSRFDHDPDGLSPGHELDALRKGIRPWFAMDPACYVCTSNHGSRPFRQAYSCGIPSELIKSYRDTLDAPAGWKWADSWEFDGVVYEHGEPYTGAAGALRLALANMQSTVCGHIHSHAGIQYSANSKFLVFGFNAGCLIDRTAYAFNYGRKLKSKPILGCGVITRGVPTFIPMQLDRHHRWTGAV